MTTELLEGCTGVLVLSDGTVYQGLGCGAVGEALGEVCFNTAMTGYQEILTDPSYMEQIVAFTFPHVGNVGVNAEDVEQLGNDPKRAARGAIFRDAPTAPANWRSDMSFDDWMKQRGVVAISGVDDDHVYVNDPWITRKKRQTPKSQTARPASHADFMKMALYDGERAVVLISN